MHIHTHAPVRMYMHTINLQMPQVCPSQPSAHSHSPVELTHLPPFKHGLEQSVRKSKFENYDENEIISNTGMFISDGDGQKCITQGGGGGIRMFLRDCQNLILLQLC